MEQIKNNTIKFVAGGYEIKIQRDPTNGNLTAMHDITGNWVGIPLSAYISVESHITDHGSIQRIVITDPASGATLAELGNKPQVAKA